MPGNDKKEEPPKKNAPPAGTRPRRRKKGVSNAVKIPTVTPSAKCKLRLLKLERIKDYLLMEEEFIQNQELTRPREKDDETDYAKVEEIRDSPLSVGNLEEIIDDNHCIVSSSMGPEYYVNIMSFVNKDLLETGCQVLLHNKVHAVVGILADDTVVRLMQA